MLLKLIGDLTAVLVLCLIRVGRNLNSFRRLYIDLFAGHIEAANGTSAMLLTPHLLPLIIVLAISMDH